MTVKGTGLNYTHLTPTSRAGRLSCAQNVDNKQNSLTLVNQMSRVLRFYLSNVRNRN